MGKALAGKKRGARKGRAQEIVESIVLTGSETEQLSARMKRRAAMADAEAPLVNPFAAAHGIYRDVEIVDDAGFIGKRRRGDRVLRNVGATIVDRWLEEGGSGFEEPQRRAIDHCRALWRRSVPMGSTVANLDRVRGGDKGPSIASIQEALSELAGYARKVPNGYWSIFENCVRHGEPAGTAGSSLADNAPQRIAAARTVVGFVASLIAMWERF